MRAATALVACCVVALAPIMTAAPAPAPPYPALRYDRDVRPILSENCFACHGLDPNKRFGGLRLDLPQIAYGRLASGKRAVVPHDTCASEMIDRITTASQLHMPPAWSGKTLTPSQIATLRRWIEDGAQYEPHWAFVAPKRPPVPQVKDRAWPRNPVDRFILARLEKERLRPAPEADRRTLIRRVTLDLTGLPPTPVEVRAYLADRRPGAYERVVDRLLASPHYGERMALPWLDLARYADTHGYHIDSGRQMWRWRDWVIDAYNRNMPYDQFVVKQLAGDLLPNATLADKIATGFNRNHPISFEGGAIPEEYAANYIFDRIDTTATTFMGLTMRCAQCHDHKFDPITQREYYRFYAFFNNVPEQGLDGQSGNAAPFIKSPTPDQARQLAAYDAQLAMYAERLKARAALCAPQEVAWEKTALASAGPNSTLAHGLAAEYVLDARTGATAADATGRNGTGAFKGSAAWSTWKYGGAASFDGSSYIDLGTAITLERDRQFSYGAWVYPTTQDGMAILSRMNDDDAFRGWDLFLSGGKVYAHLIHHWEDNAIRVNTKQGISLNDWHHVFMTYDGSGKAKGVRIYVDGRAAPLEITHDSLTGTIQTAVPARIGARTPAELFHGLIADVRVYDRELAPGDVGELAGTEPVRSLLTIPPARRTAAQQATLTKYWLEHNDADYRSVSAIRSDVEKDRTDLDAAIPTTMIMEEMPKPRDTYVLVRGQYDHRGDKVTPGVPAIFPPLPAGMPSNRLALARWLVSPSHPLTARVAVNRYWQMHFGEGIVRTPENFGTQGDRPTNPALLDWLATEFIRTGWNVKAMQRLIVTSATYRQTSRATPALLAKDPENTLLAHAPRVQLDAEFIRDQALAVAGLLNPQIGGPSFKSYQPPGLWEELAFGGGFSEQKYVQDHGPTIYRRGMYTFWKRTCPPPSLQVFDAPEREFCIVRRTPTNTPLQGLVLMNDPTYVEAARKFAERIMREGGASAQQKVSFAYNVLLSRAPRAPENALLRRLYRDDLVVYRADPSAATKLLSVGDSAADRGLDRAELAAWTTVASVMLNLDEAITRQ